MFGAAKRLIAASCLVAFIASAKAAYIGTGTGVSSNSTRCHGTGTGVPPLSTGYGPPSNSSCPATTTALVSKTAEIVSTVTDILNLAEFSILGDDFVPNICRPYTFTQVITSASRFDAITTVTQTDVITVTSGTTATVTVPTSDGFTPIQDTLPGATYARGLGGANPNDSPANRVRRDSHGLAKRASNGTCTPSITETRTMTITATRSTTSTITWTGSIVLCPLENTYYQLSEISTFFTTFTTIQASPSYATTTTETVSTTTTVSPPEVSVYAACATNNWADSYVASNGSVIPIRYTEITGVFNDPVNSAYECCVRALTESGGRTFLWSSNHGCYFNYPPTGTCDNGNVTVYYGGNGDDEGPNDERIVGNTACGAVRDAKYGPNLTITYPLYPEGAPP